MTSSDEIRDASLNDTKVKVMKGRHRKPLKGVKTKVSTPGSAGAGSVLRRLRTSKVAGKARDRAEVSRTCYVLIHRDLREMATGVMKKGRAFGIPKYRLLRCLSY
ncbi:hypothetical protein Tco_1385858 [Tanacetum coccineum]